ncbi:hypothetical protein RYA05_04130 [Pseudomonas syringae pv. actinidiae]|nr:hypothetical protein [Pseudomonas syringae pv. actinidiae]
MPDYNGLAFANAFLAGKVQPFAYPVEDSKPFHALASSYSERNSAVESAVMELAHGSCHALTVALAKALDVRRVVVITDNGLPIHSGLFDPVRQLILDANGVHSVAGAEAFWSGVVRNACKAREMIIDDLLSYSGCDESDAALALEDFDLIAQFIYDEHLISAPLDASV